MTRYHPRYSLKKLAVFIGVLLLLSSVLIAQNRVDSYSATLLAYWNKGEKKTFNLEKTIEQRSGKSEKDISSLYTINIEVLDKTDSSYTLAWHYTIRPVPGDDEPALSLVTAPFNNLRLVYTTDQNGSFKELTNMEEIQKLVVASFDTLIKESNLEPEIQPAIKSLKQMFTSREGIENILLKDIQLFHSFYGLEFTTVKQTKEAEIQNMFGGDPLPAVITSQYSGTEKDGTVIRAGILMEVDDKAMAKMMRDIFNKLSPQKAEEAFKSMDMSSMKMKDTVTVTIQVKSGWVDKMQAERLMSLTGIYKKDLTIFSIAE